MTPVIHCSLLIPLLTTLTVSVSAAFVLYLTSRDNQIMYFVSNIKQFSYLVFSRLPCWETGSFMSNLEMAYHWSLQLW